MKWLGLVLMTLDHVNKYLFDAKLPGLYEAGRLCVPLFSFVLGYNLARSNAMQSGMHAQVIGRLLISGLIATPFYIAMGHLSPWWWPLNIMFMLLVATGTIYLVEKKGLASAIGATVLFILGGSLVEFWWPAIGICVASWWYCKYPSGLALTGLGGLIATLFVINGNLWAMAALPVILSAPHITLNVPRWRHVFYFYYPAHLALLLGLQKWGLGN